MEKIDSTVLHHVPEQSTKRPRGRITCGQVRRISTQRESIDRNPVRACLTPSDADGGGAFGHDETGAVFIQRFASGARWCEHTEPLETARKNTL
jgi:hypothetical protein